MEYKLNKTQGRGLPMVKDDVYVIPTIVFTEIVGQTHSGFQNMDLVYCPILKTDDVYQIQAKMDAFALQYIAKKYPKT